MDHSLAYIFITVIFLVKGSSHVAAIFTGLFVLFFTVSLHLFFSQCFSATVDRSWPVWYPAGRLTWITAPATPWKTRKSHQWAHAAHWLPQVMWALVTSEVCGTAQYWKAGNVGSWHMLSTKIRKKYLSKIKIAPLSFFISQNTIILISDLINTLFN